MQTTPKNVSATMSATGVYERPEQISNRTSECVYQGLTVAAMLILLASLWVF
jgi:hypothetical protein